MNDLPQLTTSSQPQHGQIRPQEIEQEKEETSVTTLSHIISGGSDKILKTILSNLKERDLYRSCMTVSRRFYRVSLGCCDLSIRKNFPIRWASEHGMVDMVQFLLWQYQRSQDSTTPMIANWHANVVGQLTQSESVKSIDPSAHDNEAIYDNEAIILASRNGHVEVVDLLLTSNDRRVNPAACDNEAICVASEFGNVAVVMRLLQECTVDPSVRFQRPIRNAVRNHYGFVVHELLKHELVDPKAAIGQAIKSDNVDLVHLILQDPRSRSSWIRVFDWASEKGFLELIIFILKDADSFFFWELSRRAKKWLKTRDWDVDEKLQKSSERSKLMVQQFYELIDQFAEKYDEDTSFIYEDYHSSSKGSIIISWACKRGYADVVHLVLLDSSVEVDPDSFLDACENGHTEIVRMLLDRGCDPTVVDSFALRVACENGHTRVVQMLLEDGRAAPYSAGSYAILKASENGHSEIVRMLLEDGRIDPADHNDYAIRKASENGHVDVVRQLLGSGMVDPRAKDNDSLRKAKWNGHTDVVELLLKHLSLEEREYHASLTNRANCIISGGSDKILKMILSNLKERDLYRSCMTVSRRFYRVSLGCCDLSIRKNFPIRWASEHGMVDMVQFLLWQYQRSQDSTTSMIANWHANVVGQLTKSKSVKSIDPSACDNEAIILASRNGHVEVVLMLLYSGDDRVNPSARGGKALRLAIQNDHIEVISLLLNLNY